MTTGAERDPPPLLRLVLLFNAGQSAPKQRQHEENCYCKEAAKVKAFMGIEAVGDRGGR